MNELLDTIADENCSYAQSKFIRGYRLGVLMTMEIMSEQETFLGRNGSKQADFTIKSGEYVWRDWII